MLILTYVGLQIQRDNGVIKYVGAGLKPAPTYFFTNSSPAGVFVLAVPSGPCLGFLFPSDLGIPDSVPFLRGTYFGLGSAVVADLVCPAGLCSDPVCPDFAGLCFGLDSVVAGCCRRSAVGFAAVAA